MSSTEKKHECSTMKNEGFNYIKI